MEGPWGVLKDLGEGSWRSLGLLVRTWRVPGGSWRLLKRVLERPGGDPRGSLRSLRNAEYRYL